MAYNHGVRVKEQATDVYKRQALYGSAARFTGAVPMITCSPAVPVTGATRLVACALTRTRCV